MLTLGLLAMGSTAMAADYEPFMWGVGAKLGTVVVPGQYPARFPDIITNYNFVEQGPRAGREGSDDPNRDLDSTLKPIETSLRRVKGDFRLAADGFVGIDASNRIGATVGLNSGKGMSDVFFTANYDSVLMKKNPFSAVAGLGLGFGQMTFKGIDDEDTPKYGEAALDPANELLKIPYFPVKGRVEGQFHTDRMMYGIGAFVGTAIPSNMYYTDLRGNDQPEVGGPGNFLYLVNAGLELSVHYGDFVPPKKNKPPKNRGGGGKSKNGGGGGGKKGGKGGGGQNSGTRGGRG